MDYVEADATRNQTDLQLFEYLNKKITSHISENRESDRFRTTTSQDEITILYTDFLLKNLMP